MSTKRCLFYFQVLVSWKLVTTTQKTRQFNTKELEKASIKKKKI